MRQLRRKSQAKLRNIEMDGYCESIAPIHPLQHSIERPPEVESSNLKKIKTRTSNVILPSPRSTLLDGSDQAVLSLTVHTTMRSITSRPPPNSHRRQVQIRTLHLKSYHNLNEINRIGYRFPNTACNTFKPLTGKRLSLLLSF